ncbi:DUF4132 domain-containing protein [Micromonospora sp. NPDC047620]|uniref:DUF4132 domain-containing protein n=1 Tax=Micromonospora sp. NPDC047620 TaxID=3364251 RepID=UPI0037237505
MRTFEYVGGSAARFWQVERDDATVTIRYGRLGSAGRTQVKELGSAAAAATYVDKLVAEKLRKGYAETAATGTAVTPAPAVPASPAVPPAEAPAPAPASSAAAVDATEDGTATASGPASGSALPDEETFVVPDAWRRNILPRHDGVPGTALPRGPKAVRAAEELLRSVRAGVERFVERGGAPDVIEALRAHLAGDTTPLGAGALIVTVAHEVGWYDTNRLRALADGMVATDGVVFAARALAESADLHTGWCSCRDGEKCQLSRQQGRTGAWCDRDGRLAVARRVRAHLAAASVEDYAAARAALAGYRGAALPVRVMLSFLMPTEADWVAQDVDDVARAGDHDFAELMLFSVNTAEQCARMADEVISLYFLLEDANVVTTATAAVGPALAPVLAEWFDNQHLGAKRRRRLVSLMSAFPTDEAMRLLLDRLDQTYVQAGVLTMLERFPVRGLRLLAASAEGNTPAAREAAQLLHGHAAANPAAVAAALPGLGDAARQRVTEVLAELASAVPQARPEQLPPVLVDPPWRRRSEPASVPPVTGVRRVEESAIAWLPGERERFAAMTPTYLTDRLDDRSMTDIAREMAASGRVASDIAVVFYTMGPEALARPLISRWRASYPHNAEYWLRCVLGRFERDALPVVLRRAQADPAAIAEVLLPVADSTVADLMAGRLDRSKSRTVALAWLHRHPAVAARALLPAALGMPGPAQRAAERAMRVVAVVDPEAVRRAAEGYGPEVVAAATAAGLLDADPLAQLPPTMPTLPPWVDPAQLPPVLLRDRAATLPADAVRHLGTMLAISRPGEVYPGVDLVRRACDPASLAEFGWALFERWQAAGHPPNEGWALTALGWLGDDETARRLAPVIRAWPGEGGHARAVTGLGVLASIGTDVALMHLWGLSQKAPFRGLREQAGRHVAAVAAGLGLDAEQLGDRLVPDLGLDTDGSLVLDYGPRRFTVGFDEQLKPYVVDDSGARRKDLPKPGARDDQGLAPAAYQRFTGLKKDVRTLAADQIRRFEAAMVTGRRWPAAEFRRYFLDHPLLWHVVRRLVWATFDADGALGVAFRVAEDRSLADVSDEIYELPAEATVGIAHPWHLGAAVPAWAELFADYEILQPFAQLGREVHHLAADERDEKVLGRFAGVTTETTRLLGLERRGWRRGDPQDGGFQQWFERILPGNRAIVVDIDPGIAIGAVGEFAKQEITRVWVNDRPYGDWRGRGRVRFGDLDPVVASELLRDLTEVTR